MQIPLRTRTCPYIKISQHIYAGKKYSGMIVKNSVDVLINVNNENEVSSITAERGFIANDNSTVSIKLQMDKSMVDGNILFELLDCLHKSGKEMLHSSVTRTTFDAKKFTSTVSVIIYGKEYYVPTDSELGQKAINYSGIINLDKISNKEILQKIESLID